MRLVGELERRDSIRHEYGTECELLLADRKHRATVIDASHGGVFVQCDAPAWPGAMVRLRLRNTERYAVVLRERQVPYQLRNLVPRGFGLRWVRSNATD